MDEISAEKKVTSSQLALAWVLAQGEDIVPIPGTKRVQYLEENVRAADIRLSTGDIKRLKDAIPVNAAAGTRYTEAGMKAVGR